MTVAINCYALHISNVDCSQPNCDDSLIKIRKWQVAFNKSKLKRQIKNIKFAVRKKKHMPWSMKSAAHFPLDKKVQVRLTRLAFATSSASAIAAGVEKAWPLKHGSISRSRLSSLLLRTQKWQPRSVCYKRVLPSTVEPLCTTCDLMFLTTGPSMKSSLWQMNKHHQAA